MAQKEKITLLVSQGDEKAFNRAYFLLLPKLKPFVYKLTRSDIDTQEIIQETFTSVWQSRCKLKEVEDMDAWVFKIASHLCYNYLRRKTISQRIVQEIDHRAERYREDTQEKIQSDELAGLVDSIVEGFSDRRKEIYLMSRENGMKIAEIATSLGLSSNTVKNTLVHSLKQIRQSLKLHGFCWGVLFLLLF